MAVASDKTSIDVRLVLPWIDPQGNPRHEGLVMLVPVGVYRAQRSLGYFVRDMVPALFAGRAYQHAAGVGTHYPRKARVVEGTFTAPLVVRSFTPCGCGQKK